VAVEVADYLATTPGIVRVAIDGAHATKPDALAAALIEPLQALGRPSCAVRAATFWRDASVRLEYGHTDEYALRHDWLDLGALRRELLDPLGTGGSGRYLPSLRDPATNRSTRAELVTAPPGLVLLVSGQFLLGHELPFDRVIRLSASPATLARSTPADLAWTLPVIATYEAEVEPSALADIDIRVNDPRHPAISFR
jgi:hypothetical protein